MLARDIMSSPVITAALESDVQDIARLLLDRRISAVPVVDAEGTAVGVVSEGDLMRRTQAEPGQPSWWLTLFTGPQEQARRYVKAHGRVARDVMSRPVISVPETMPLADIAATLERHRIKRVVVLHEGKPSGIVSRANLVQALASQAVAATAPAAGDAELRARLQDALEQTGIRTSLLNVVVTNGVGHVWGAVGSREEQEAVRVAAQSVPGIRRVEEHVGVLPRVVTSVLGAE